MQLVQEMYHVRWQRFKSKSEVQQKVSSLTEHWILKLVPAICGLAKEAPPASDEQNCECFSELCAYIASYVELLC